MMAMFIRARSTGCDQENSLSVAAATGIFITFLLIPTLQAAALPRSQSQVAAAAPSSVLDSQTCHRDQTGNCSQHSLECGAGHRLAILEAAYGFKPSDLHQACQNGSGSDVNCSAQCCSFNASSDCKQEFNSADMEIVQTQCSHNRTCHLPSRRGDNIECSASSSAITSTYSILKARCIPDEATIDPCSNNTISGNLVVLYRDYDSPSPSGSCYCRIDTTSTTNTINNNSNVQITVYDIQTSSSGGSAPTNSTDSWYLGIRRNDGWMVTSYSGGGSGLRGGGSSTKASEFPVASFPMPGESSLPLTAELTFGDLGQPTTLRQAWIGFEATPSVTATGTAVPSDGSENSDHQISTHTSHHGSTERGVTHKESTQTTSTHHGSTQGVASTPNQGSTEGVSTPHQGSSRARASPSQDSTPSGSGSSTHGASTQAGSSTQGVSTHSTDKASTQQVSTQSSTSTRKTTNSESSVNRQPVSDNSSDGKNGTTDIIVYAAVGLASLVGSAFLYVFVGKIRKKGCPSWCPPPFRDMECGKNDDDDNNNNSDDRERNGYRSRRGNGTEQQNGGTSLSTLSNGFASDVNGTDHPLSSWVGNGHALSFPQRARHFDVYKRPRGSLHSIRGRPSFGDLENITESEEESRFPTHHNHSQLNLEELEQIYHMVDSRLASVSTDENIKEESEEDEFDEEQDENGEKKEDVVELEDVDIFTENADGVEPTPDASEGPAAAGSGAGKVKDVSNTSTGSNNTSSENPTNSTVEETGPQTRDSSNSAGGETRSVRKYETPGEPKGNNNSSRKGSQSEDEDPELRDVYNDIGGGWDTYDRPPVFFQVGGGSDSPEHDHEHNLATSA